MNSMLFIDRSLHCRDCGDLFIFTADEQVTFASRGIPTEPRRCGTCRIKLRALEKKRAATELKCANCGSRTHVPAKPSGFAQVYCCICRRMTESHPA